MTDLMVADVRHIHLLLDLGIKTEIIAARYDTTRQNIWFIRNELTWKQSKMDFEHYRRTDGSINLCLFYEMAYGQNERALNFLQHMEELKRVNSRQVAALAVVTAFEFAKEDMK